MSIRDTGVGNAPVCRIEGNIVIHDLSGFSHLSLELMHTLYKQRIKLAGQNPRSVIIIADDVLTVDFEVQLHASNPKVQASTSAIAVVGDSFMLKHLTSMFLSYHAPAYPVELFSSLESAKSWLKEGRSTGNVGE